MQRLACPGIFGKTALLSAGATLPEHRKHGCHHAVIAARIKLARELGCTDIVSIAYADGESHHNMERLGLQTVKVTEAWPIQGRSSCVSSPIPFRSLRAEDNGFVPGAGFRPFALQNAESTVAFRFRESALRHADRIALVDSDRRVTYRDLLNDAEGIGSHLQARSPDGGLIAILMPFGLELVKVLLGALAGGFAYLLIDTRAPDAEIGRLITASRPALIITHSIDGTRAALFAAGVPCIDFHSLLSDRILVRSQGQAAAADRADAIAAVYATSGSTGEPKLVGLSIGSFFFLLPVKRMTSFSVLRIVSISSSHLPSARRWLRCSGVC